MSSARSSAWVPRPRYFILAAAVVIAAVTGTWACGSAPQPTTLVTIGVPERTNGTPWVAADGSFVAVAWGATTTEAKDVFVAVSRDNGQTFGTPVRVNSVPGEARLGGEQPPRVALTKRAGSAEPEILVLWGARGDSTEIKTSRSRDGGRTFDAPAVLQTAGAVGDRGWHALAVDSSGNPHALWLDHRVTAAGRKPGEKHVHGAPKPANYDSVAEAQKSSLYYANASSSGPAERELAKGVCYCCKTSFIAGPAGELYAAWRHVYPGDLRDMAFTVSRDGGKSFSDPVRVSEDGWAIAACPDDGPSMAVDHRGAVHIAWPTVIDGPELEGALFYSTTQDGKTFAARTRIPTLGLRNPSHVQLVSDRKGRLMVAWDEYSDGHRVASAREITRRSDGNVEFGPVVRIAPSGPATYPVLAATSAGILAVWSTGGESPTVQARTIPWR